MYLFEDQNKNPVGQVRIDIEKNDQATIGISIDAFYRGKGYGQIMLKNSCHEFHNSFPDICIHAYIKTDNITSFKIFEKANFVFIEKIIYNNSNSLHYVKYANR